MRLSLLNVGYAARMQLRNLATVGYMSIIARPAGMNADNFRKVKHVVRQRCLHNLLEPLKQLSHQGIRLSDPEGTTQLVYPRLLSMVTYGRGSSRNFRCVCHLQLRHPAETLLQVSGATQKHG